MTAVLFLILFFAMLRTNTRVTWLVHALVVMILSVFGSLASFVFLQLCLSVLLDPLLLLLPRCLLSGIII
jgi:nucleoside recognition membrane protein YjiH